MSIPTSSISNRTSVGKYLIRAAIGTGRLVRKVESSILHTGILAPIPFEYRKVVFCVFKLILVLAVASVALILAIGMIAVWTIAALPISADRQPLIHEVSHPRHHLRHPEMYDDNGAPR